MSNARVNAERIEDMKRTTCDEFGYAKGHTIDGLIYPLQHRMLPEWHIVLLWSLLIDLDLHTKNVHIRRNGIPAKYAIAHTGPQ